VNFHTAPLDLVEELQFRRWARLNYVPLTERSESWNSVIHDEMTQMDHDSHQRTTTDSHPIESSRRLRLDGAEESQHELHSHRESRVQSEFYFA